MKSTTAPIAISCELDSVEEPIRGRLRDAGGREVEFSGWMEFSTALLDLAGGKNDPAGTAGDTTEEGTS